MSRAIICFVFGLYCILGVVASSEKKVVCYYGTWATYRSSYGKFDVDNINVDLCTHIIYTFVGLNSDSTVAILDPYLDLADNWGKGNFDKFTALKQKNPKLKTILAVGGWNEGSYKYSVMAASANLRQTFINSAIDLLLQHDFDGFDIDWEYPNQRDTVNGQADVNNFTQLLKELKEALDKHGLLLSIAVAAVRQSASLSYDIPAIAQYVEFIGLMTYDMNGPWDPTTGHNAGLHRGEGDEAVPRENLFTVDVALEYWISAGCPPEKLVIGLPFYGRTFTLTNIDNNGVRAPASGVGIAGPYTATNGLIGYNEFCYKLQTETWDLRYDSLAKVPYAVQGRNWVSYENPDSLAAKIAYGLTLNIGGAMVWSIETDDFHGLCHDQDFPLLRAINKALKRDVSGGNEVTSTVGPITTTTTTTSPSSTSSSSSTSISSTETSVPSPTTSAPTSASTSAPTSASTSAPTSASTSAPSSASTSAPTSAPTSASTSAPTSTVFPSSTTTKASSICKKVGLTSNPKDCTKFYYCIKTSNNRLEAVEFSCPANLLWDQSILACNYDYAVDCP